ncbi:MAG: 50S ribosomal protein L17 [Candidatus Parcubacteria bacterium]|nr:50S ribosomal protein L17 [Candidatus Parcubacteria bacterium]
MQKLAKTRKFGRKTDQRKAFIKALISALILKGKIKTTLARAKAIAPATEKLITRAKKGDMASKRLLIRFLSPKLTEKLIKEIAPSYKERNGGYTRIIKTGPRQEDGAKMAIIELVK